MSSPIRRILPPFAAALMLLAVGASAQQAALYGSDGEIRRALAEAQAQGEAARQRAERLEGEAARAGEAADRTAREAAGVAARIQQIEARIVEQEAQGRLIARQRAALRARLAERQRPVVRLTAALQRLSRRPPALSLLRPGSVTDTMHMRAILATMLPEVEKRTAGLRAEIARGRALEREAQASALSLRTAERDLSLRRQSLAALETRQRLASRAAGSVADREEERALGLAEKARDLDALAADLGRAGELRQALERLPGPVQRPARPEDAQVAAAEPAPTAASAPAAGPPAYIAPVAGRLVAGFGDAQPGRPRSRGIALAVRPGAQVIAPGAGRVVFAGPYRGYGRIAIIEHAGGWTSLVTGLAQLDARVGDTLVAGSPLGIAGPGAPIVSLELRRDGEPVNPLDHLRVQ